MIQRILSTSSLFLARRGFLGLAPLVLSASAAAATDWEWTDPVAVTKKVEDGFEADFRFNPGTSGGVDSVKFPCECTEFSFSVQAEKPPSKISVLRLRFPAQSRKGADASLAFLVFPKTTKNVSPQTLEVYFDDGEK